MDETNPVYGRLHQVNRKYDDMANDASLLVHQRERYRRLAEIERRFMDEGKVSDDSTTVTLDLRIAELVLALKTSALVIQSNLSTLNSASGIAHCLADFTSKRKKTPQQRAAFP